MTTSARLNGAKKPMCLDAIDQPLVDRLTLLVHSIATLSHVQAASVPDELRDLFERVMASVEVAAVNG